LGLALKASRGESGFELWDKLSSEAEGYEQDKIEKEWRSFGTRSADQPRITIATYYDQAKKAGWVGLGSTDEGQGNAPGQDGASAGSGKGARAGGFKKGISPASHAVSLAKDAGDEFWLDRDDKPHVTYEASLPDGRSVFRHAPVASEAYRGVLKARFYDDVVNNVLTSDQANLATELLSAEAWKSGERYTAALRVGGDSDRLYVDLGRPDGAAVEIDQDGGRVVPTASVRFVRGTRGELPEPEKGGTIEDFKKHFNVSPDDLLRTIGFIVGTFNVDGSYCLFMTDGPQGSGKSNFNDKIVNLVDPPRQFKGARMAFTHKEQDLHIGALGSGLIDHSQKMTVAAMQMADMKV